LAVGLFIAIVLPLVQPLLLFARAADALIHLVKASRFSAAAGVVAFKYVLDSAVLLLLVRFCERKGWDSIGIKKVTASDVLSVLATCFTAFLVSSLTFHFWPSHTVGGTKPEVKVLLSLPRTLRFALFAANSLVEELGSRAYVVERSTPLTGNLWLAGCLSGAASFVMHSYVWGFRSAIGRVPNLLLLVGLYMWRRNLAASVLAHFFMDAELSLVLMLPKSIMPWVAFVLGLGSKL